jgi:hypothetical protein
MKYTYEGPILPSIVPLPFGAPLLSLLFLEETPLPVPEATEERKYRYTPVYKVPIRKVVDNFPFETYSRNTDHLKTLTLLYLQEKVPVLAKNPGL